MMKINGSLNKLSQKKILFAPYNDISNSCKEELEKCIEFNFRGFVDKNKIGSNIINPVDLSIKEFDIVIISSGAYFDKIYNEYLNYGVEKEKIFFFSPYSKMIFNSIYIYSIHNFFNKFRNRPIIDNSFIDFELYIGSNSKKLHSFMNKHENKRAFIIGNGPSLNVEDLNKIKDEITFAANKIYLSFSDTQWRPTYYFVEDDLVFKQNFETISKLKGLVKFFPTYTKKFVDEIQDAIYYRLNFKPHRDDFPQISSNPFSGFYWGSTVIYSMLQMAIYMGIKEIYLLGLDFEFKIPKSYNINTTGRKDLINSNENNHFHKDYRKKGEKWNMPNLDIQLKSFQKAKEYCIKHNIKIFNVSRSTKLDIFEKYELDNLEKRVI